MRLLFDHNLSPRLVARLADLIPNSSHVSGVGLDRGTDRQVWELARRHGYAIVTKDSDFADLGLVRGFPPRVVHLRIGNCTTDQIDAFIRGHHQLIEAFDTDSDNGTLELGPP